MFGFIVKQELPWTTGFTVATSATLLKIVGDYGGRILGIRVTCANADSGLGLSLSCVGLIKNAAGTYLEVGGSSPGITTAPAAGIGSVQLNPGVLTAYYLDPSNGFFYPIPYDKVSVYLTAATNPRTVDVKVEALISKYHPNI